jgi:hypothetical protein
MPIDDPPPSDQPVYRSKAHAELASARHCDAEPPAEALPVIPSDAFILGENDDLKDPKSVKLLLSKTTFGEIIPDHTIEAMCAAGLAQELFPNGSIDENHPNARAWLEMVSPTFADLWNEEDLELRARLIIERGVYGIDNASRDLILSVADSGMLGGLAQANLREPEPSRRRPWPWWYRPRSRQMSQITGPNLFKLLGED